MKTSEAARANLEFYDQELAGQDDYWRFMAAPRFRIRTLLGLIRAAGPGPLVDLGCGNGLLLAEVAKSFPTAVLAGIDLSPRLIAHNRRQQPGVTWRALDLGAALDLPEELAGRFRTVVASEIIEHVDDPATFLHNAGALAAAGGTLLLSTQSGEIRETERRVGHVRHFSRPDMETLLHRTDWVPLRVWNSGFPFHDLSKWWANRDPGASMRRFGERRYGPRERAVCAALRLAFRFNSRSRGAQLFAVARRTGSSRV